MSARRWAAGLGGATVLALASGCGMLGIGGGDDARSDEERLLAMLNDGNRAEAEMIDAEYRVVQKCLEDKGFTVHEPWAMQSYETSEQESLVYGYPHESYLIDKEEAAEWGFGAWADTEEAQESGAAEDYWAFQEEKWAEEGDEDEWQDPDSTDWDALEPGDQYDWYVAYQGEEYAENQYGSRDDYVSMMSEEEMSEEDAIALEEEMSEEEMSEEELAEGEGEISVEEEEYVEPKPGGCQLEMIEAMYGEPRMVEDSWEGEGGDSGSYTYWEYRPENPTYGDTEEDSMWADIETEYASKTADVQGKLIDCIAERGYAGWEFDQYGALPVREYLTEIYYDGVAEEDRMFSYGEEGDVELAPLPEDMPKDYEAKRAYEIQMAIDFGECGDEVGFADASEKAYDDANVKAYAAIEEEYYAWTESMNDSLAKAQELLDK